eukprot:956202-Rhodomonas_salina.2
MRWLRHAIARPSPSRDLASWTSGLQPGDLGVETAGCVGVGEEGCKHHRAHAAEEAVPSKGETSTLEAGPKHPCRHLSFRCLVILVIIFVDASCVDSFKRFHKATAGYRKMCDVVRGAAASDGVQQQISLCWR